MKELISVIVPVYNVEQYLPKCIESITNQTYKNLEIILVDDGSTDNSGRICDEYAQKDERIIVLHKENEGQATARNMALDIARGEYIGFADSDDYLALDMFEKLYEVICSYDCDISMCGRYILEDGNVREAFTLDEPLVFGSIESLKRLLLFDNVDSAVWDKLFKRQLLDNVRFPAGYICEDVDFVFRVFDKAEKVVHCGKPYYYYYVRKGSTCHGSFSDKTMGLKKHHKTVCDFILEKYPKLKKEAEYFYFSRLPALYKVMVRTNYKGEHKKEICKDIVSALNIFSKNKYFSVRERLDAVLISIHLYDLFYAIKKTIRG